MQAYAILFTFFVVFYKRASERAHLRRTCFCVPLHKRTVSRGFMLSRGAEAIRHQEAAKPRVAKKCLICVCAAGRERKFGGNPP